ncbi:MAG TPA: hypothetical protein VMI35_04675, partial [Puia sp.]|nr:hypothetical protein [Puia sp.]
MAKGIEFKKKNPSLLEKFGTYYLSIFRKQHLTHYVFDFSDDELARKTNAITSWGIVLSALVGLVCVWPTVYVSVLKKAAPFVEYWIWVGGVTLVSVIIELYLLFVIALKTVHRVSELINMHASPREFLRGGPFGIISILSRTALEIPDPELIILGIDPFEKVSKKNLLILSLLYKLKIILTNLVAKFLLKILFGSAIAGVSINYVALPVECFWNAMVLYRVVKEARLRMFGFALCNHIAEQVIHDRLLGQLSTEAKIGCLRAIGNAVVLGKQYHPNMILLMLRFEHLVHIYKEHKYDDWALFLQSLQQVNEKERNFLLDL